MTPTLERADGSDELRELIAAVWNDTIRPPQCERLEDLLAGSEAAREFYLSCMALHAQLLWQYRDKRDPASSWPAAFPRFA